MINIKKLSVVALVLLVVGIVGGLSTYSSAFQQAEEKKEKIIKDEFSAIEISSDNAEVDIIPTKESVAKIELVTKGVNSRKTNFKTAVEGKTLSVTVKDERGFRFGFFSQSNHLTVFLPKKQYESMKVENGNGEVQVEQMKIDDVRVTLINGEAQLNDLTAKHVKVESSNGKIQLNDVMGEIRGSTVNGEIHVATKALDRPLELESTNGEITVQTEKEPTNTRFDVSVVNGEINILDKYNGSATIGKGENLVKLTTVNGEVSVTR
jgi:DUF4097 and DUF4098 domain-containing protein YvlB